MNTLVLQQQRTIACLAAAIGLAGFLPGCRPAEQIETYVIRKEAGAQVAVASAPGKATDRMLAAIVPDGDKAWFFKVVGPVAEVDAGAADIEKFFASIRPAADKSVPDWKLPDGWKEQPASGMRAATLVIPASDKPMELTVTSLPWRGTSAEILSNVNRWRGQMQLAPVDEAGLGNLTHSISAGDTNITVVDLRGQMEATGMMPPFAGGGPMQSPSLSQRTTTDNTQLPPGHPPIEGAEATPTAKSPLTFDIPLGWTELPAGGMRKAAFGIGGGDQVALVTVIDFPVDAGPMMADPLENVNRWRREVGLEPITRDALDDETQVVEIDGAKGRCVEAIPDASKLGESQADRATLAAMVQQGKQMWFIKLTGNRDVVVSQRDKFKEFLASLKFTFAGGATHGN